MFWQIELTLYNPKDSLTGKLVSCGHEFCKEIGGGSTGCNANSSCLYTEVYGDGSYTIGYFVEDVVQYDRISGDLQTKSANGTVIFGYVIILILLYLLLLICLIFGDVMYFEYSLNTVFLF